VLKNDPPSPTPSPASLTTHGRNGVFGGLVTSRGFSDSAWIALLGLILSIGFVGEQGWTWLVSWRSRSNALSGGRLGVLQTFWRPGAPWERWLWAVGWCGLPLLIVPAICAASLLAEQSASTSLDVRFLVARTMDLHSGRSLLLLSALLVAITYVLGFCHLRRLSLLGSGLTNPLANAGKPIAGSRMDKRTYAITKLITRPVRALPSLPPLLATAAIFFLGWRASPLAFESRFVDDVVGFWLLVASTCIVLTAMLGVAIWMRLRPVLVLIAYHPIAKTLGELANAGIGVDPRRSLYLRMPALASLQPVVARWKSLAAMPIPTVMVPLRAQIVNAAAADGALVRERSQIELGTGRASGSETERLCKDFAQQLVPILFMGGTAPDDTRWNATAQEIVALELAAWIGCVATHVWTLLAGASLASFLVAFLLTIFPIQPQFTLTIGTLCIVGAVVIASSSVLVQMEREPVLSRLSGTTANRIERDWTFVRGVVLYVVVPIASLVAARVPQLSRLFDAALRGFR